MGLLDKKNSLGKEATTYKCPWPKCKGVEFKSYAFGESDQVQCPQCKNFIKRE